MREARAYNYSIYLMVSLPYLMIGGLGVAIYRNLQRKSVLDAELIARLSAPNPPSPNATS